LNGKLWGSSPQQSSKYIKTTAITTTTNTRSEREEPKEKKREPKNRNCTKLKRDRRGGQTGKEEEEGCTSYTTERSHEERKTW
jgi:hypothetical protein